MDTFGRPEDPHRDDLSFGPQGPVTPVARRLVRAVPLVTVGLLLGWGLHGTVGDDSPAGEDVPPAAAVVATRLLSGGVHPAPEPLGEEFTVSLHNPAPEPVEILSVAPQGWPSSAPRWTIPPGAWVELPLDVDVRCGRTPPPGDALAVATRTSGRRATQVVPMPAVPAALQEKYERLCTLSPGTPPTRDEVTGVWLVERARDFAGTMLIELAGDGRFAMGPTSLARGRPGAHGTFELRAGSLTLSTLGGRDCRRGDRARWDVGLRQDGRLHIRHRDYAGSWCSVERGEVWIARRLLAGSPHRSWTWTFR